MLYDCPNSTSTLLMMVNDWEKIVAGLVELDQLFSPREIQRKYVKLWTDQELLAVFKPLLER